MVNAPRGTDTSIASWLQCSFKCVSNQIPQMTPMLVTATPMAVKNMTAQSVKAGKR